MRRETICPECGETKFGEGTSRGEGRMYPSNKLFSMGSEITHVICIKCGLIIRSFVKEPEKFDKK
ncbi:transcription initiation factor TFIIIB [Paenibacillus sp. SYP-B3998]|uniref:Transcription initiation factor TFIIIB n=1 Tax=Paenibacillus sp. SYP-B3998 TaxID=2678564 RepID=A0A6G3ZR29_9BACL|nr:transcription initiation factor TFIIIB [Paenibacillus sp. SYP-B3998]NEW04663.1 transcription initiation factor TFIIIB [Paenibacillus sp. SYP-B3998]